MWYRKTSLGMAITMPTLGNGGSMFEASSLRTYTKLTNLQRYITFIPTIAFGATLQASWESVAVSFQAGLYNGGPV
jgi:hypothetical protein